MLVMKKVILWLFFLFYGNVLVVGVFFVVVVGYVMYVFQFGNMFDQGFFDVIFEGYVDYFVVLVIVVEM